MAKYDILNTDWNTHQTDEVISLVTQRAIPDGGNRVSSIISRICSYEELGGAGRFASVAREYVLDKFPVLKGLNEETLDAALDKEGDSLTNEKGNEIVVKWMKDEKTRLGLGESLLVPPISEDDGAHFVNLMQRSSGGQGLGFYRSARAKALDKQ